MKEKELKLIKDINKIHNSNLKPSSGKFDVYDAENDKSIIEIKIRNVVYETHYIQVDKFFNLLMVGEGNNKKPFFMHVDKSGIYIYDLSRLKENIINTSQILSRLAPYRTEFFNDKKINKYFYELSKKDCILVLPPSLLIMN